jgi:ketosteroid isomerase-like protein
VSGKTGRKTATKRPKPAVAKAKAHATRRAARPARKTAGGANATRALARKIVDLTLSGDDEAVLGLYAADVESSEAGQPPAVGIDALRAKFAGWRAMTSDTAFEPRRVCVDGNVIVVEWVGRVTLAASGRQVEMREVAVHEIRDGKIAREAFYYNPAVLA